MIKADDLGQVNSILVFCWGLIGDVFVRVPLIEALKQRFPQARIVAITDPVGEQVLLGNPACDEVMVASRVKKPLLKYLVRTFVSLTRLRKRHFDLSIDLYGGGSSPLYTRAANANIRISFDNRQDLLRVNNVHVPSPSFCGNWTRALASILGPLGIRAEEVRRGTSYFCSRHARYSVAGYFQSAIRYVGINLGAGDAEKCWPVSSFVVLARNINQRFGLVPLVFSNPGMEYLAQQFEEEYQDTVLLMPLLGLDEVGAAMLNCEYVVTGDTSLMHLAIGLKRPILILFTYTRPEVVLPEDCPVQCCFKEGNTETDACGNHLGVNDISVDEAFAGFSRLVEDVSLHVAKRKDW